MSKYETFQFSIISLADHAAISATQDHKLQARTMRHNPLLGLEGQDDKRVRASSLRYIARVRRQVSRPVPPKGFAPCGEGHATARHFKCIGICANLVIIRE